MIQSPQAVPVSELLASRVNAPGYRFYASAWLLVHCLMMTEPDRFQKYQEDLAAGQSFERAWDHAFGWSPMEVQRKLMLYYEAGAYAVYSAPIAKAKLEAHPLPLRDADVYALRALLFRYCVDCGDNWRGKAQANVRFALASDTSNLRASAVQWTLTADAKGRLALARRLAAAHPSEWLAWLLLVTSEEATGTGGDLDELGRSAAVRSLLQVAPSQPFGMMYAARQMQRAGNTAEALQLSARALAQRPSDVLLLALRGEILARARDCAGFSAIVDRIAGLLHEQLSPEDRARLERAGFRCMLDQEQAGKAAKAPD